MDSGVDHVGITTPFYCHDGKGNFLFHKRSENCRDEQLTWDMGSGKLEVGSTIEGNILRELHEEYGCRGVIDEFLPPYELFREHNGIATHWVVIGAIVRIDPQEARLHEPEKMLEIEWFNLKEPPTPLHSGCQQMIDAYKDRLQRYMV